MPGRVIVRHVVTFSRVLREVGIEVGPGRVVDAVRGLGAVELTSQRDVYFTLRQTLVCRHDDLELFDRAFVAWFLRGPVAPPVRGKRGTEPAGAIKTGVLETVRAGAEPERRVLRSRSAPPPTSSCAGRTSRR